VLHYTPVNRDAVRSPLDNETRLVRRRSWIS
jgi:hypothetical protein